VRGTIRYPETAAWRRGRDPVYQSLAHCESAKAAQCGEAACSPVRGSVTLPDVPGDVQNYKLQHEDFPHDSTAEQWFTESQFESYRCLGVRVIESLNKLI